MTEHAPISTIVPKSSANLGNSTLSAVHPSAASPLHNSLHRLVSTQPARPRHSNPHSACGSAIPSLSAVSSLGGFRTPAAELAAPALKRPASETLHNSGARADIPAPPLWAKTRPVGVPDLHHLLLAASRARPRRTKVTWSAIAQRRTCAPQCNELRIFPA